jgi:hypothetical protein
MDPVEQTDPHLLLKKFNLMAYCGRSNSQFIRCDSEGAKPGRSLKRLYRLDGNPVSHCINHMNSFHLSSILFI